MARWEDTLDIQLGLWQFWNSPEGERYGQIFGEELQSRYHDHVARGIIEDARSPERIEKDFARNGSYYDNIPHLEKTKLLKASPFYVSDDVMTILEAAEPMFQSEPLRPEDLITPAGFVVLPRPFKVTDANNVAVTYRAFSWAPVTGEYVIPETGEKHMDQYGIIASSYSHIDDMKREDVAAPEAKFPTDWVMLHVTPWWFGEEKIIHQQIGGLADSCRQFLVFNRLAQQMITTRESRPAPRASRRRAKRAELQIEEHVTVITLRRAQPKNPDPEQREVDWKHRWLVEGHWRWQYYPSINGHKQIWISTYVKGPEDKELLVKERAFEFTR